MIYGIPCTFMEFHVHDLWNSINDLLNSINDLWNSIIKHIYGIP